jgi:hypothetical protein
MRLFRSKKAIAVAASAAIVVGVAGAAFAYYTATGSGSGTTTAGSATALALHQATNTSYVGQDDNLTPTTDNKLYPGDHAVVTFTVDNTSQGNSYLGTISVSSITSDQVGCSSAENPSWFDLADATDTVNHSYAPGIGQAVTGNLWVKFYDVNESQNACSGATLTFHYSYN